MRSHPCCTSITQDDVKPWRPFVSARLTHMPGTRWCPTEAALKPDHRKGRSCNSAKIEHANFHSVRCNPTSTCLYLWVGKWSAYDFKVSTLPLTKFYDTYQTSKAAKCMCLPIWEKKHGKENRKRQNWNKRSKSVVKTRKALKMLSILNTEIMSAW